VDHYRKNGNQMAPTMKTQIQKEMDLHTSFHWDRGYMDVICYCGVQLYPDCDSSSASIAEAHWLHVIEVFGIQIQEDFEIKT
jgi:hypothetical protein